jgi:hypothetical protein
MPATPYAKLLVSVNGGATQSGGITVSGGDTIDLTIENTTKVLQQKFEIYDYPTGVSCPSGWSTDANGVYYYATDYTPPQFTISIWGKYMLRLTVNNGLRDGRADATLVDTDTALSMLSADGIRDLGDGEERQFGGWIQELQEILRLISITGMLSRRQTRDDKRLAGLVTTIDGDQGTSATITHTPVSDGYVRVFVNGHAVSLKDGPAGTGACYFSGDGGTTARAISAIAFGDTFHWVGSVAGFELDTSDLIDWDYEESV